MRGADDKFTPTLQHTATHCNTLQHTATRCNTSSQKYGVLMANIDAMTSNEVDKLKEMEKNHARELDR